MNPDAVAPDERVPGLFDTYCELGLAAMGVGWKEYRDHRLAGTWNQEAKKRISHRPERFMVEEG